MPADAVKARLARPGRSGSGSAWIGLLAMFLAVAGLPRAAGAGCNLIPVAAQTLPSTGMVDGTRVNGYVDRPIAGPGQRVTLRADVACMGNPGFALPPELGGAPAQNVVKLTFKPPINQATGLPAGPETEITVPPSKVRVKLDSCGVRCTVLQFDMPNTDANDPLADFSIVSGGLTGPAEIRVERADLGGQVVARVHELYQPTRSCFDPDPALAPDGGWERDTAFALFTVLPKPNVLEEAEINLFGAVDGNGGFVMPLDFSLVLRSFAGSTIFTEFRAFTANAVFINDSSDLHAYNDFGRPIPPVLRLIQDPAEGAGLLGTTDVLSAVTQVDPILNFAGGMLNGIGPVQVANTKIQVESAAPVSTLNITGEVIAVGASEPVLGDRDNDLDASHLVVEITDVATGVVTNTGKALALASASPLKPTIVTSGNKAGFLENESLPLPGDVNLDGDQFDQILRVYATDGTGSPAAELTNPPLVSANPLSKVRGRPLAISNECGTLPCPPSAPPNPVDFVFFRSDEDGEVPSLTERASRNDAREQEQANAGSANPSIDDDGGLVAFDSRATNLVNESIPAGRSNVYVFDRATGEAELISAGASGSGGGDADSSNPSLSPDGGFVAFESLAGNLQ